MLGPYTISPAQNDERNFVADSWRRSLQDAPAYSRMPTRGYVAFASSVIKNFLGHDPSFIALDKRDRLYVARDDERPSYFYGWLLGRDMQPGFALVFVYVKGAHRRQGVAKDLLAAAIEATEEGPLTYAFRTRMDGWFDDLGMTFSPVENLEFGKRGAA